MGKMSIINTKRFASFGKEEQDVVRGGVELFKHYLYAQRGDKRFAEFANGSYEEKESLFTKNLMETAVTQSGIPVMGFSVEKLQSNPNVKWAMFNIVGEILDTIIPQTVLDGFSDFATVKNLAYGDSLTIKVPNNDIFTVSDFAEGIKSGDPQRLYQNQITLIPTKKNVTIEEDLYRVLAGKSNWGDWVVRVAISYETKMSLDIYNTLFNTYANLPANLKVAGFTQDAFVSLAQKVQAMNRGAKVVVMGTKLALSKILPSDASIKFGLGQGYMDKGYVATFMGIDLIEIGQVAVPQTDGQLAVDDNTLYFVSQGLNKLVLIGFEGATTIKEENATDNADETYVLAVDKRYDIKAVSSYRYGMMKLV